MPMIPPLVRDPLPDSKQSSTGRPVSARMVRPQRRYASNFNISFVYEPPRPIPRPGPAVSESTFDKWRATAAALELQGAGGLPGLAARGDAALPGVAPASRRRLHDALLGTTAVVLLGVLGGIGYLVWSGALPGAAAPGGTVAQGSGVTAFVQPFADIAAKAAARAAPDHAPPPPSREEAMAGDPAPQPAAPPPSPSAAPNLLALATPAAEKPALADPPPAPGLSAVEGAADPAPERVAAGSAPPTKPSGPDAAPPVPAMPSAAVEAVRLPVVPAPERAAAAVVPPAKASEPDATLPARPAPAAEPVTARAAPPASDVMSPVPAIASVTVRLPPPPEWTGATASASTLASLPEAVAPPAPPAASSAPVLSAEPTAGTAVMAKVVPPGVRRQMPLPTHDESLRSRMEMAALARAARVKAWRLKLAEARSAAAAGSDAGGPQAGLPASAVTGDGSVRAAAAVPQQVLRGIHVQKGSPDAAVLSAGPEQTDQHLVMVGDQLPGVGRVIAILPRGGSWIVRTERGVIR